MWLTSQLYGIVAGTATFAIREKSRLVTVSVVLAYDPPLER